MRGVPRTLRRPHAQHGRGNPLRYNDPSGHCAARVGTDDPDGSNATCWGLADTITQNWDKWDYNGYWSNRASSKEVFNQYIASSAGNSADYFQQELDLWYHSDDFKGLDAQANKYIPPSPGQDAYDPIKAKIDADFGPCIDNFPLDCGNAADDIGVAVTVVGVIVCTAGTAGACGVVSGVGTVVGAASTGVAAFNVSQGNAPPEDLIASWGTTWLGGNFGTNGYGTVGLAISLFQLGYDIWAANR